ncbi:MAG: hypothetical protein JWN03_2663 [Nocardia sp.]|uniref:sensor histidine kinase n=1 Tax=Nocardia sp. TaxID=1821 RepID=UPI0026115368|nr:sensor histidine kinase [Nocardia sp.]MCU1642388.1 hypothetical protein [Nocardia sp.]
MTTDIGELPSDPFLHLAFFYRGSDEYLAGTMEFIRTGLANGEPVAVAVPGANLALVRDALGADAGAVLLLDMAVAGRNPGRIIPSVKRAFADAHPQRSVRIVGEPIWAGRSELEYPACGQHEALINAAFTGREATILCPYNTAALDKVVLDDALRTHPVVVDSHGEGASASYDPGRILASYNEILPAAPPDSTVIAFDEASLANTRHTAAGFARSAGITADRAIDLELVVAEATTNSVVHGGGSGALTLWVEETQVVCRVQDNGCIADPLAGRIPVPPNRIGGRGLLLINQLSDLVRLHTTPLGNTLQMHFAL